MPAQKNAASKPHTRRAILSGTTPMLNATLAGLGLTYAPEDLAQP